MSRCLLGRSVKAAYNQSMLTVQPSELVPSACPAADYLLSLAAGESRRTTKSALNIATRFWRPGATVASFPWTDINRDQMLALRAHLQANHAPATANRCLSAVKQVLGMARRANLIDYAQYARTVDVKRIRGKRLPRGRALSMDEIEKLLSAARAHRSPRRRARDAAMIVLLYCGGLRRAELCGLKVEDIIHEANGRVRVRVLGKGNKEREVPLPLGVWPALEGWMRMRQADHVLFPAITARHQQAGHLHPESVRKILIKLIHSAGIAHASPHDFRRTFISSLLGSSQDISAVQALVGHAQASTTLLYDRRGEAARLSAVDTLALPNF
jgi:integrase/recombinase XerD